MLKIGDEVRVKESLQVTRFTKRFIGKLVTIISINKQMVLVKEDGGLHIWSIEDFEINN